MSMVGGYSSDRDGETPGSIDELRSTATNDDPRVTTAGAAVRCPGSTPPPACLLQPACDAGVCRVIVDRLEILGFDGKRLDARIHRKLRRHPAHQVLDEARMVVGA